MNKKSKIISAVTAAAVATSALAWSAFADEPVVHETKPGALLGAATHFHIFAEEITLESHVHGNVATNMLNADRDFGVRPNKLNGLSSINYIKDFSSNLNEQTLSTMLVVGSDVTVNETDNGNKVTLTSPSGGSGTFRHSDIGPVYNEDEDTPYIDIKEELKKLAELSEDIAAQENSAGISQSHSPFGAALPYVNVSSDADGFLYYTIDVSNTDQYNWDFWMFQWSDLYVNGLDFSEGDFLYLTIDVGDRTEVSFPKSWKVSKGGPTGTDNWGNPTYEYYSTGEEPLGSEGRIIYNIVSNGKPYEGKLILGESKSGSILAPKADVEITGNTNGTIIGKKVTCKGESHRWDVQVEGTYDANDKNPDLTPEEEEVVTTTTTAATTTPAPETTTTTTKATTTTPEATTTTAKPTTTTTEETTTSATTTTEETTTSATTTTEVTTTSATTTSATTTSATTVIGGGEGDYEGPTTTTSNVGGNEEEVTTTTSNVGGNDEEVTTTTSNNGTGSNDEEAEPELPTFDEMKEMLDKLPEEITDDETAEEYDKLMSTITEMIEKGDLTSSQTEELENFRKVLSDKYTNYVSSTNDDTPNTGFKAGVTIAISAGVILILAALAGRKKLEE